MKKAFSLKLPSYDDDPVNYPSVDDPNNEVLITFNMPDWQLEEIEAEYDINFDTMEEMDQLYLELDEYLLHENSELNTIVTSFRSSCCNDLTHTRGLS